MNCGIERRLLLLGLLAVAAAGCGLKGPLELPEASTNVVIRGPQQAPAPATPTQPGSKATTAPKDDRLPPPPLPGGNTGS